MTQRSPMNERYTTDKPKGTTRKSASSAKPKREAASSVTVVTTTKSKAQKKAERKAQEQKMRERDARYYNPRTPEYKRMRMYWGICVGLALAGSIGSFLLMGKVPAEVTTVLLILAYAAIAAALYIDLVKIRRIRKKYAAQHADTKAETRALKAEKAQRAAEEAAKQAKAAEAPEKKPGLFARFKKKDAAEAGAADVKSADAGKETPKDAAK